MRRTTNLFYWALSAGSLTGGLVLASLFVLPYPRLSSIADKFSRHGHLRSFTPLVYSRIHYPLLVLGCLLAAFGLFCLARPKPTRTAIERIIRFSVQTWKQFWLDAKLFFSDLWKSRPGRGEFFLLALILVLAAVFRLQYINRPIEFDEGYTFVEFARHSFMQVISDYSVPNNHVFHTILVHFSYRLFGDAPWAIRLPVLIGGLLLIPATYLLGRSFYDRTTGLLASAAVAFLPILVLKSVSARGYILVAVFTMLSLLAATYVLRHRNLFGWFCLALFIALGAYSVPVMLFPAATIGIWLLISGLKRDYSPDYQTAWHWWRDCLLAGIVTGLLAVALYSPILWANGVLTFFHGNTVVNPLPFSRFISSFPEMVKAVVDEWELSIYPFLLILLFAGMLLSVVLERNFDRRRFPLQAAVAIGLAILLLVQRPGTETRIWLWLVPLCALWASAGWIGLFGLGRRFDASQSLITTVPAAILAVSFLITGGLFSFGSTHEKLLAQSSEVEQIALYLKGQLTPQDVVVVTDAANPCYWYYFIYHGIPDSAIRAIKERPFSRAFVVVYPNYKEETLVKDIENYGPDLVFFDLASQRVVKEMGGAVIYVVNGFPDRIQKAFGQQ